VSTIAPSAKLMDPRPQASPIAIPTSIKCECEYFVFLILIDKYMTHRELDYAA